MKKTVAMIIAFLLVASLGTNIGIFPVSGLEEQVEKDMMGLDGDCPSLRSRDGEDPWDVPTWKIGTSWTYYQESFVEGDEEEELPRIKWMELEEEFTYTVAGIEYVEVEGTMTPLYNVTLEGDITGGEGVLETDAAGEVQITIEDEPSTVHGYILHRMDDLGILVDYEYRYMEADVGHWAVHEMNIWQVSTDTHEPIVEEYDFPLTPGGHFWANNTVHTEGYNRVYVNHAFGDDDETVDLDETFDYTRQVSVSERDDPVSVPAGGFETYNVTKDADFVNVNDHEDEGEIFWVRDYNGTVQNYVKEYRYQRRINNETEWTRELTDYHIPDTAYIGIEPEVATVSAGDEMSYTATAYDTDGNWLKDVTSATDWSDDVDPEEDSYWIDNEIIVNKTGEWTITGEYNGLENDTILTVEPGDAVDFWIEPKEATVDAGVPQEYTAHAEDEHGNVFEVTDTAWNDDVDPEEASDWVDNEITVEEAGNWTITGEYGEFDDTATLVVEPAEAVDFWIEPEEETIIAGESQAYNAYAEDEYGNEFEVNDTTWSDDVDPEEASDWVNNEITVEEAGTWTITGEYGEFDDTATLVVEPAEAVDFWIEPVEETIIAGDSQEYTAHAEDEYGNEFEVTDDTTWNDDVDPEEASDWVENNITVNKTGTWTITGTYDNEPTLTNTSTLHVESAQGAYFEFEEISDQTAGEDFEITIRTYDEYGNFASNYNGTVQLMDTTETISPNEITFEDGIWAGYVNITEAHTEVNITADDGYITGESEGFRVEPGEAVIYWIEPEIETIFAGTSQEYTAYAEDKYENEFEVTDDTTWSDSVEPEEASYWIGNAITVNATGEWTINGTYDGFESHATLHTTHAEVDNIVIIEAPETVTAGESFNLTIQVRDELDNPAGGEALSNFSVFSGFDGEVYNESQIELDDNGEYVVEIEENQVTTADLNHELTTEADDVSEDTVQIEVEPANPNSIEVSPSESGITAGTVQAYNATAYDEYGNEIGDVTEETTWSDNVIEGYSYWDENEITVNKTGTWTITGEYNSIEDTATLLVDPAEPQEISIEPQEMTVILGDTVNYTATAFDQYGNEMDVTGETDWSIEEGAGGTWDENEYLSENPGEWTVNGTYEYEDVNMSDTATLNVLDDSPSYIVIEPDAETATAGESVNYTAKAYSSAHEFIAEVTASVDWFIEKEAGGTWDDNVYTSEYAGSWMVVGTYEYEGENLTDTATLNVEHGDVDHITVTPKESTITAGETEVFTSTAYDEYGNEIGDVTGETTWSDNVIEGYSYWDENEITVNKTGTWTITGEHNSFNDTATLLVIPAEPEGIKVTPEDASIDAGDTEEYEAVAYDEYGNEFDVTDEVNWSIEEGAGGTWIGNVYVSEYAGEWTVEAEYGELTNTTTLTVETGDVSVVEIDPDTAQEISAGESIEFEASAYDRYGNLITNDPEEFTWSGADEGSFDETEAGVYEVNASYEGVSSQSIIVTVVPAEADHIVIMPEDASIKAGDTQEYQAVAYDGYGNEFDVTDEVTWSIEEGAGGTWIGNVYVSEYAGEWTVDAEYGELNSTTTLTVETGDVSVVEIDPDTAQEISAGESIEFEASAYDQYGNLITNDSEEFTWSGADDGFFDETEAGVYEVNASYGGVSSQTIIVTVVPAEADYIVIMPEDVSIDAGDTEEYEAVAFDGYGNEFDVTDEVTWSIEEGAGGTWIGNVYVSEFAGEWTVDAEYGELTNTTTLTVETGDVSVVEIDPDTAQEISAGESIEFEASAYDQYGNLITNDSEEFTWSGADHGFFDETKAGEYEVNASYGGVSSQTIIVTVVPAELEGLEVTPEDASIKAGDTQEYQAVAYDGYDNEFDVTDEVTWSIEEGAGGTWIGNVYISEYADEWIVEAEYNGMTDTTTLTVETGDVSVVEIDPDTAQEISAGDSIEFEASAYDKHGNLIEDDDTEFTWNNVTEEGLFEKETVGRYEVTAEYQGITSDFTLVVVEPGEVESVEIEPGTDQTIDAGETKQFSAKAYDGSGNLITDYDTDFYWKNANGTGLFNEEKAGEYEVTATYRGFTSAPTNVTVSPGEVESIDISPDTSKTITAGETINFSAEAFDEYENLITDIDFNWTNTDEYGLFNETTTGIYEIRTSYNDISSKNVTVRVESADVASFEITVENVTSDEEIVIDITDAKDGYENECEGIYHVHIIIKDSEGVVIYDEEIELEFIVGRAEHIPGNLPPNAGEYIFEVYIDGIAETSSSIIDPSYPYYINITPEVSEIKAGETIDFSAEVYDRYDNQIEYDDAEFEWSNTDENGLFYEENVGKYEITAEYQGITSEAITVTVEPAAVYQVVISPGETEIVRAGTELEFSAEAYDEYDNLITDYDTEFYWRNADGLGFFNEEKTGEYEVTATYRDVTSEPTTVTVRPLEVHSVTISPDTPQTIKAGETIDFSASVYDEYGNLIEDDDTEFTWVNADRNGLFDEKEVGRYEIVAAYQGLASAPTTVNVEPGEADRLVITPDSSNITAGDIRTYTAMAYDQYGNEKGEVTGETEWSIDTGAGGSWVNNAYYSSEFVGNWNITGTYEGLMDTVTLTVESGDVAQIEITSSDSAMDAGSTKNYTATAYDRFGNEIGEVTKRTEWSIDEGAGGSWDNNRYTSEFQGTWTVTGEYAGLMKTVTLTVEPGDADHVLISPEDTITVSKEDTLQFTAQVYDYHGNLITDDVSDFSWNNADEGLFHKTEVGEYGVTAAFNGVTSSSTDVIVGEASFEIEITDHDKKIDAGDRVVIEYKVSNTGDVEGAQDIVLTVDGEEKKVREVILGADEVFYGVFTLRINEVGESEVEVASGQFTDTAYLDIEEDESRTWRPGMFVVISVLLALLIILVAIWLFRDSEKEDQEKEDLTELDSATETNNEEEKYMSTLERRAELESLKEDLENLNSEAKEMIEEDRRVFRSTQKSNKKG